MVHLMVTNVQRPRTKFARPEFTLREGKQRRSDNFPKAPLKEICPFKAPNPFRQWRIFFASSALLSIYFAHFCMNWTSYVVMQWLPTYLHTTLHANPLDLSLACLPYVFNSLVSIGWIRHPLDKLSLHCLSVLLCRRRSHGGQFSKSS